MFLPCVYGIENDYYKIEIPKTYEKKESVAGQELYSSTTSEYTSSILIYTLKNNDKLDIAKYTSEDIKNQENTFKNSMIKQYEEQKITANIKSLSGKIEKLNNYDSIIMNMETEYTFKKNKSTVYQKQYLFSSMDYLYYIIISTSSNDLLNSDETKKMLSSFEIKKELFEKDKGVIDTVVNSIKENPAIYVITFILIVTTIVVILKTRTKKGNKRK